MVASPDVQKSPLLATLCTSWRRGLSNWDAKGDTRMLKYSNPHGARAVLRQLTVLRQQERANVWDGNTEFQFFMAEDQWDAARRVELNMWELGLYAQGDDMAKKTGTQQVTWRGFKDVRLTDAQRDAYENWDIHDGDVYELLASAVSQGFKFTCSYNNSNDTYTATLTGQAGVPDAAKGYSLSAFAPTWYDAVRTLAFKHDAVLEGDWSRIEIAESNRWG